VTGFIIRARSDQSRLMESDPPARPVLSVDDFTVNLVDTILAILQAPVSVATGPAATEGTIPGRKHRKELPGMFFSALLYLSWFCRLQFGERTGHEISGGG
jgi:hypothetical protein